VEGSRVAALLALEQALGGADILGEETVERRFADQVRLIGAKDSAHGELA
jgi:hypothetical protein